MARILSFAKFAPVFLGLILMGCSNSENYRTIVEVDGEKITVVHGFVRKPSQGAFATAGYLTIHSTADDALVSVSSPIAETVEIHIVQENAAGAMAMRPINELTLPAGETVVLEPGSTHLMMMGPSAELQTLEEAPVLLTFASGASVQVDLPIWAVGDQHNGH